MDTTNMRFLNKRSLDVFYKNSKNNIEDPIFTGFTLAIDTLNSPLFFSLCGDEFAESLRSVDGMSKDLSNKIEEKLQDMYKYHVSGTPESYEINTVYTKDELGDRMAGYGLQERYYMDKPIYGAVDYIYMVDKVSEGQYTDSAGSQYDGGVVTDLGNGNDRNIYRDAYDQLNNQVNVDIEQNKADIENQTDSTSDTTPKTLDASTATASLNQQIQEKTDEQNTYKEEHEKNVETYNALKSQVDSYGIANKNESLNTLNAQVNVAGSDVSKKFEDLKQRANGVNGSRTEDVNKLFNDFIQFVGVSGTVQDICNKKSNQKQLEKTKDMNVDYQTTFKFPDMSDITNEIERRYSKEEVSDDGEKTDKTLKISNEEKSNYEKIYLIQKTEITEKGATGTTKKQISDLNSDIQQAEKDVYGVNDDGTPKTMGSPGQDSLYSKFKEAEHTKNTDAYTQCGEQKAELEWMRNNVDDIVNYEKKSGYRTVNVERNEKLSPVTDNTKADDIYSRELFEVPQTVYDMMGFIYGMKDITTKFPYVLQTVTGLDEAYKNYFEIKDPYMGSGDNIISIDCLEFLDLKVSAMFNKYFNAVYDRQYRRERVPVNLRRFNCSIFVHDIRNFKNSLNGGEYPGGGDLRPLVEMALNYISAIEFKFYDCEFIPKETGSVFDSVSNVNYGEQTKTKFAFSYGNCVINFLPFEDLRKYLLQAEVSNIIPPKLASQYSKEQFKEDSQHIAETDETGLLHKSYINEGLDDNNNIIWSEGTVKVEGGENNGKSFDDLKQIDDGNFRRWFDRSDLGNVNNNDYRDYVRNDSYVAVDDYYKSTMVNDFALNSVVNKNRQLTEMDDALRRIVTGISASTGIPVKGVTDALNIQFIDPILNEKDLASPVVKEIGNVNNSKVIDPKTMEYIGELEGSKGGKLKFIDFLGNINEDEKEKGGK